MLAPQFSKLRILAMYFQPLSYAIRPLTVEDEAYICSFSNPQTITPAMLPGQALQRGIGVWARGLGEFGTQTSSGDRTGFAYKTGGFVGGVDWQPRRDVILGIGAAYLGTGMEWSKSGGNANINYAKFGLYGSYFTPRIFIDAVLSGGLNWTAAQRQITILSDENVFFPVSTAPPTVTRGAKT